MQQTILLIEDDPDFQELIRAQTEELQLGLDVASDGAAGLALALTGRYPLVIVDVSLPKLDGFEICKRLRAENDTVQILFLTSRSDELDRVLGLELGADDYVIKPGSMRELCSRIRMLLRRHERLTGAHGAPAATPTIRIAGLEIDRELRRVLRDGERIELTPIQFRLFDYLLSNPEKVCSRTALIEEVWGHYAASYEATLTKNMSRLRAQIEVEGSSTPIILTLQGVGYRLGK